MDVIAKRRASEARKGTNCVTRFHSPRAVALKSERRAVNGRGEGANCAYEREQEVARKSENSDDGGEGFFLVARGA